MLLLLVTVLDVPLLSVVALTAGHSMGIYLIQKKTCQFRRLSFKNYSSTKALPLTELPAGQPTS